MFDVIICLGSANKKEMKIRAKKSCELYHRSLAGSIIFTGGSKRSPTEAELMASIAIEQNISREDIIIERKARSTIGNAVYSNEIMDKKGFESAIVVTSPHHIRRTKYLFSNVIKDKRLRFVSSGNVFKFYKLLPTWFEDNVLKMGVSKVRKK